MRYIIKTHAPASLVKWIRDCQSDINFGYNLLRMDDAVSIFLLEKLCKEQYYLCGYTGIELIFEKLREFK